MTLTIHLSAFATCVTINGTQECVGSPPILTSIKSDRLVYENSDKPVITITGVPYSTVNFEIDNQSGKKVFSHLIEVMPTGLANYTLDISSYKSGLYTAIANASNSVTTIFRIGLVSSGQVNSSSIIATNSSDFILPIPSSILHSPIPTLSLSEIQSVVNVALSISELQSWSHDWQYVTMGFGSNNKAASGDFEWQYASVVLKAPSSSSPFPCNYDWQATVVIDMTTMKVVSADYPTMKSHICNRDEPGDTSINQLDFNNTELPHIPSEVKNNAKLWSEGGVDNSYFVQVLDYLIENEMKSMLPDETLTFIHPSLSHPTVIPSWIKNDAEWWSDGKINDTDFVNAMYYLLDKGIIRL